MPWPTLSSRQPTAPLRSAKKVTLIAIVFSAKGTPTTYSHIKLICSSLSNNFPETMARALVFPTNIFSRGIWHVVKLFLDPVVREKVVLLGGGRQPSGLPAYIAAENMLEEYGGQDTTSYAPST